MKIKIKGYDVLISECDFEKINQIKWNPFKSRPNLIYFTYKTPGPNRKTIYLHKFIMGNPKEKVVDHINCNTLDNRRENLRICTQAENVKNARKSIVWKNPYKGVSFNKLTNRWRARIQINKKTIYLGYYDTPEKAYGAYVSASKKYHGEFGRIS